MATMMSTQMFIYQWFVWKLLKSQMPVKTAFGDLTEISDSTLRYISQDVLAWQMQRHSRVHSYVSVYNGRPHLGFFRQCVSPFHSGWMQKNTLSSYHSSKEALYKPLKIDFTMDPANENKIQLRDCIMGVSMKRRVAKILNCLCKTPQTWPTVIDGWTWAITVWEVTSPHS